jgi:hypothetical protein
LPIVVATGGGAASLPAASAAAVRHGPRTRIETPIRSAAPDRRVVRESYVRLRAPLPASDGPRPPACDWIGYLRFRAVHGPRSAWRADAVFVTMPGIFAGASMLDQFARNTVRAAAAHGRHVEVWTLDRRSNCLEDHFGTAVAARAHNAKIAFDYYFHGGQARGRRFAGYKTSQQAAFLSHVGLSRTVRDEYIVIARNVPRRLRTRKVFCGGHSLGGPLTTAFADWDFDGNPRTTRDAGYNQCAGFFALDTRLSLGSSSGGGSPSVGLAQALAAASNGSPYVNAPPFTPETIQAVAPTGVAAFQQPGAQSSVPLWTPDDANFQATYRTLFSRDAANAITQIPSIRDFRVTNEVALAAIFDDNSAPVTILRASLGTYTGGPVAQKSFPAPYGSGSGSSGGLVDGMHLMIPTAAHGPLYRWWNFNRVGRPGTPVQLDDGGHPFTSRASEISDIHQFARIQFEAPADFSEQYFPTRLLADESDAEGGDRSGDLASLRYDGIPRRPALYADAQHGIEDGAAAPPRGPAPNAWIRLTGYDHIDVATAAWRQNSGHGEAESRGLATWAAKVLARRKARRR